MNTVNELFNLMKTGTFHFFFLVFREKNSKKRHLLGDTVLYKEVIAIEIVEIPLFI
jgi:hypothetical protein